jgi:two-component system sensor histidine kinase BaeS
MAFTTRTKITALFVSTVSLLVILLNMLVFESANKEWQKKKSEYMHNSMVSLLSLDEAKEKFPDLEVTDKDGAIIHQQGIFTHDMKHVSIGSFFFPDKNITSAWGRAYYWGIETKADGYMYKTVDDITDILSARDMLIERSLWISLLGIILIIVTGYVFSGYILRPIQNMNQATRRFSLSQKDGDNHVGIYGNIKDDVVILARSLEELFHRVNKEAEKLEQFSDDIAHEIKNRLFEVMSSLDIAENPEFTSYGISKAKRVLKQLSSVVDALLFFARNDVKDPQKQNLAELIRTTIGNEDSRIHYHWEMKIIQEVYPELFMTAVGNIVSNAQKFTPEDGSIDITLSKNSLTIQDNGIGISEKDREHIFDRLYKVDTARTSGSGHGLGLSIAKKIIEWLHGMSLSVESQKWKGTSFIIDWSEK